MNLLLSSRKLVIELKSQEGTVKGVIQLHFAMARLRIYIFLSGLDSEFDQVRGEILRKDPKLDLESTYAYVRREYQQRQTMGSYCPVYENLAMLTNTARHGSSYESANKQNIQPSKKVNNLVCTHYGEKGHSQQWCNGIIGYLEWWDFLKKPRKKISSRVMTTSTEDQQLPTTNVAHPGNVGKVHVFPATYKNKTWMVDTSASEHITRDVRQLQYVLLSSQSVIPQPTTMPPLLLGKDLLFYPIHSH